MSAFRSTVALVGLVCVMFVVGCQPTTSAPASAPMGVSKAVLVNGGNGASVFYLTTDGSVHSMSTDGAKKCQKCEDDAEAYFKTGKIDPVCSACGAKRSVMVTSQTSGIN